MIPQIVHYCWISGEENMSEDIKKCIESWHKYLPEYKFINWNDTNFNWNLCDFTKHCRKHNLYAFCADYIRYWALYNYGGIYLDCDVEVFKSFNDLLHMKRILTSEVGRSTNRIEAAILGCEKGDEYFGRLMRFYTKCVMRPMPNSDNLYLVAPDIMKLACTHYKYSIINIDSPEEESLNNKDICLLNAIKYFDSEHMSDNTIARHHFKNSWIKTLYGNDT